MSILRGPNKEGPYNHDEILEILSGEDWTAPMEEGMV